ncbi:hypothetical protein LCGC14_2342620, partial [marine sediment metagenome]
MTTYDPEGLRDRAKIDAVLAWARGRADFKPDFVQSLSEGLEKYSTLRERQRAALDNIITKFHIVWVTATESEPEPAPAPPTEETTGSAEDNPAPAQHPDPGNPGPG